jgi:glycosyltransferase involved in cell wall biosynthesis
MNVLYVNHTSAISGAERSLRELLSGLPSRRVSATVACPRGELTLALRAEGISTVEIPGTSASLRLHPWHTTRGLVALGRGALAVRAAARATGADLVHANSIRAGLMAAWAASLGAPAPIVHVRDCLPATRPANLTRRILASHAAMILANSDYTARSFIPNGGAVPVRTIHNAVDLAAFDPGRLSREEARRSLGFADDTTLLGVVAQITPWKAQDDAVRVVDLLRRRGMAVCLLLVGAPKFEGASTRFDNTAFLGSLHLLARQLGAADVVRFLGERSDVPAILRALDVLLVPSWEEPFGRSIIEAMAMGVCVLSTNVGGPAEIITDNEDGVLLPPRSPVVWADTVERLVEDPPARRRLCERARITVTKRFTRAAHVAAVLGAYGEIARERVPRLHGQRAVV